MIRPAQPIRKKEAIRRNRKIKRVTSIAVGAIAFAAVAYYVILNL